MFMAVEVRLHLVELPLNYEEEKTFQCCAS